MLETIDLAPVTERDQAKLVLLDIEPIDYAVITHPETEFRPPLQAIMGKILQPPPQLSNPGFDALLYVRWQTQEYGIELMGVNLRSLLHRLALANSDTARAQVCLSTLNARHKFRI